MHALLHDAAVCEDRSVDARPRHRLKGKDEALRILDGPLIGTLNQRPTTDPQPQQTINKTVQ